MVSFARKKHPELPRRVDNSEIKFIGNMPRQTDGCVYGGHSVHILILSLSYFSCNMQTLVCIVCPHVMEQRNGTILQGDFTQVS
jgi:hypothetical protein